MTLRSATAALALLAASPAVVQADEYVIDTAGMHAAVQFRTLHLGYSWLNGRFNTFEGSFEYDPDNPANAAAEVRLDVGSLDTNHAERDKHLRSDDFLDVEQWPEAHFVSTAFESGPGDKGQLHGQLTLKGVTRAVVFDVQTIGGGKDPWGGERFGFEANTVITAADYGIDSPVVGDVELQVSIEGVKR